MASTTSSTRWSTAPTTGLRLLNTTLPAYRPRYGKVSGRCAWPLLPPELLCTIAFYLLTREERFVPESWHFYRHNRVRSSSSMAAYTAISEVRRLGELMSVCQGWSTSLEKFPHWQWYCTVLDPHDLFQSTNPTIGRSVSLLPAHTLALRLLHTSCWICLINSPSSSLGLQSARRLVRSAAHPFTYVSACKEHKQGTFCSLCLVGPTSIHSNETALCISENEDTDSWPGTHSTCRGCRYMAIRNEINTFRPPPPQVHPTLNTVVPTPQVAVPDFLDLKPRDWEAQHALDTFLLHGEGLISEIIATLMEKDWYQSHTRVASILDQALAANRLLGRDRSSGAAGGYESEEELLSEEEEEDDPDVIAMTEEQAGVKEAALHDWSRQRILDGHWFSPLDLFCRVSVRSGSVLESGTGMMPIAVPATHPCSWLSESASTVNEPGGQKLIHPTAATVQAPNPPTYHLADFANRIFGKAMRAVLRPAMENIVRRLVMECEADGEDVVRKASGMTLEAVVAGLRDPGVWHNGVDWIGRRERERERERLRVEQENNQEQDQPSPISTSSMHSVDHLDATSPVLSTTTIRTTPSPEPMKEATLLLSPVLGPSSPINSIPVAPVLQSPVAVHAIPYIPDTIEHLPPGSRAPIDAAWREASAILYRCACKTCERAGRQMEEKTRMMVSQVQAQNQPQAPHPVQAQKQVMVPARKEPARIEAEEEEVDELTEEMVVQPEEEDEPEVAIISFDGESEVEAEGDDKTSAFTPASELVTREEATVGRKRHLDEQVQAVKEMKERSETPPKRLRTMSPGAAEDASVFTKGALAIPEAHLNRLPARLRKRSSQEAEEHPASEEPGQGADAQTKGHKRARTDGSDGAENVSSV